MERPHLAGHGDPEEQVVVLGAVELRPEDQAVVRGREQQVAADGREMAEIIDPEERGQIEGGL